MFDFYLTVVGISWSQIQKALVMSDHLRKTLMKWETKLRSEHEIWFTHLLSWHQMAEMFPTAQLLCFFSKPSSAETPLNSTISFCSTFPWKEDGFFFYIYLVFLFLGTIQYVWFMSNNFTSSKHNTPIYVLHFAASEMLIWSMGVDSQGQTRATMFKRIY